MLEWHIYIRRKNLACNGFCQARKYTVRPYLDPRPDADHAFFAVAAIVTVHRAGATGLQNRLADASLLQTSVYVSSKCHSGHPELF